MNGSIKKEYVVRAFQPGDEEAIVKLLELVFDGWPKFDLRCSPLEHWKWKYQDNPLQMNQITVGVSNGIIIGCIHLLPIRIKIGNRVCLGAQGADTAVHSDLRKLAIFNQMKDLHLKMRVIQLTYFLNWNLILRKSLPKFNREFPHIVMRLYRIHDVDLQFRKQPIKNALIYKYGFHLLKLANRCRNRLRLYTPSSYDFHIGKIAHFDERIEGFWEEVKDHYHFTIERNRDYLNWRYCDPRGGDYLVKVAQRDAKILGYMVLRINRRQPDYPIGYIIDLLTLPSRLDVATALVEDAVSYFNGHHINMTFCMVIKNHPCEAILKRNGFITWRERGTLFYQEYAELEELRGLGESSPSHIHFAYGDLDVI